MIGRGEESKGKILLPCSKNTTNIYSIERREGITSQIPHRRDFRGSYKGISEFILKTYKNSRIIVDQIA